MTNPKETGTEDQPPYFCDHQLFGKGMIEYGRQAIPRLENDHIFWSRQMLEVIEIERPIDPVQAEEAAVAPAAVEYLNLEEVKGDVELCHGA
jgi:hypothetical protein